MKLIMHCFTTFKKGIFFFRLHYRLLGCRGRDVYFKVLRSGEQIRGFCSETVHGRCFKTNTHCL